jgi:hypothetical protein
VEIIALAQGMGQMESREPGNARREIGETRHET